MTWFNRSLQRLNLPSHLDEAELSRILKFSVAYRNICFKHVNTSFFLLSRDQLENLQLSQESVESVKQELSSSLEAKSHECMELQAAQQQLEEKLQKEASGAEAAIANLNEEIVRLKSEIQTKESDMEELAKKLDAA